ncbi:MAG: hypothetical protein IPQ07_06675 [Myxococcales bacterium]|nr:hypothetical protein [Myxococcales bacterium]
MRWAPILLFLVGGACEKPDAPAPPPAPSPAKVGPAVAPPPADAASPDAPGIDAAPTIPPAPAALAAAPAWTARSLFTGAIRATSVHTLATLQRADGRAMLTLEAATAPTSFRDGAIGPWSARTLTRRYLGAATESAGVTTLELSDGTTPWTLTCKLTKVAVARAVAVRKRDPKLGGCEGDQGHWVPGQTSRAQVLVCGDPADEMEPGYAFVAAPAPPIEWVYVNDDCSMQGGGYRAIPADGSIAPFR